MLLWLVYDRHLPAVIWAQRNDKLYVTINVEDCQDAVVNFEDSKLTFRYHSLWLIRSFLVLVMLHYYIFNSCVI